MLIATSYRAHFVFLLSFFHTRRGVRRSVFLGIGEQIIPPRSAINPFVTIGVRGYSRTQLSIINVSRKYFRRCSIMGSVVRGKKDAKSIVLDE